MVSQEKYKGLRVQKRIIYYHLGNKIGLKEEVAREPEFQRWLEFKQKEIGGKGDISDRSRRERKKTLGRESSPVRLKCGMCKR